MLTWAKAVALLSLPSMIGGAALGATQPDGRDARIREASQLLRALPLRFEPNRGQLPGSSEFVARGPGYVIGLEKSGSVLQLAGADSGPTAKVRTRFLHATPGVRLAASDPLPGKTNYLTGNQPDRWITQVAGVRQGPRTNSSGRASISCSTATAGKKTRVRFRRQSGGRPVADRVCGRRRRPYDSGRGWESRARDLGWRRTLASAGCIPGNRGRA